MLLLGLTWGLMLLLVNPTGEFPLNDDWSYANSVKSLLERGEFWFSGIEGMTLIGQVLWGTLFCLPWGFSFLALRISVMLLGLGGILATYGLLRESQLPNPLAFAGALCVAVNPVFFELSSTFMTDVPFYSVCILGAYVLLRSLRTQSGLWLGAGMLVFATMIRQVGVIIPIAYAVAVLLKGEGKLRVRAKQALIPLVTVGLGLLLYSAFVQENTGLPAIFKNIGRISGSQDIYLIVVNTVKRSIIIPVYLGLYLLPFWGFVQPQRKLIWIPTVIFMAIAALWVFAGRQLPFLGNILFDTGLGPNTLKDGSILTVHADYPFLWLCLSLAAIELACFIGYRLVLDYGAKKKLAGLSTPKLFAGLACFLFFVPLAIQHSLFDRHILLFLPFVMILVLGAQEISQLKIKVTLGMLGLMAIFSVLATHDYLSWNRVRWQALDELMTEGIAPALIDGGFEFNGSYTYKKDYKRTSQKSWWWVDKDTYLVSFGVVRGYTEKASYSYPRWLKPGRGTIMVLVKETE